MKVQNPIIGRAKGSAGGMTAAKVYDKNVLRAKALEVNNPKTAAQVTQRDFFKQVQAIASTVTNEQLRSLFGIKPKAMSRRNALAAQIAAAYSIDGTSKTVDFSKLGAIGNGEKIPAPIFTMSQGSIFDETVLSLDMFGISTPNIANYIFVIFDQTNKKIHIVNSQDLISGNDVISEIADFSGIYGDGFLYATCAVGGNDVSNQAFGTFQIKTRATDNSASGSKGSAETNIPVNFASASTDAAVTLDFSNYDFNNLLPGELIQDDNGTTHTLVGSEDWIEGSDNEWTSQLQEEYNPTMPTFLNIMQGNNLIETVPVSVTIG